MAILFLPPQIKQAAINHEVAMQSRLIKLPHQDPADRFIAASAVVYDLVLVTADKYLIKAANKIGADMIELHTGAFCDAASESLKQKEFSRIVDAAKIGSKLKLGVNAGHGICYNSIKAFKGLNEIEEFSIGHSIISRAVMTGMDQAVKDMVQLIKEL